ncbi:MAG: hypothetical protein GY835_13655 [bacterium]|nr:hypothetical protein [bacterium]
MSPDRNDIPDNSPLKSTPFLIGQWQVQPSRNLLTWTDGNVQLTHKSMEILCLLAEANGEVVSRQQLIAKVWPGTVVNEEALTRVISDLRRALGDDRHKPRYIETIPKRGYRLVAQVVRRSTAPPPQSEQEPAPLHPEPVIGETSGPRRWVAVTGFLIVIMALFALTRFMLNPPVQEDSRPPEPLQVSPLTSDPGHDAFPSFSPDGTRIAFSRRTTEADPYHVYVKQPRQAQELQLTDGEFSDKYPTWSPDGSTVAFVRLDGDSRIICSIPSLGGPVQMLCRLNGRSLGLDWSPDGSSLAIGHSPFDGRFAILILDLTRGEIRTLTQPPDSGWGDLRPRFSPEGDQIAFVRNLEPGENVICLAPIAGEPVTTIPAAFGSVRDLAWHPDGRQLVISTNQGRGGQLGNLTIATGETSYINLPLESMSSLSLSRATGQLAVQVPRMDANLMRYDLASGADREHMLEGQVQHRSTQGEFLPSIDPTHSRMAFCSNRTGEPQIYLADIDGGDAVALTDLSETGIGALRWSPDGSSLLISGQNRYGTFLGLIDPENGRVRVLPLDFRDYDKPVWSPDGEWIYFNSKCSRGWRLNKIRPDGTDLTTIREGDRLNIVHQDQADSTFCFIEPRRQGLYRLHPDGTEDLAAEYPPTVRILSTGSRGDLIYYVTYVDKQNLLIAHNLSTAVQDTLGTISKRCYGPLELYPNGKSLLVATTTLSSSDLIIVPLLQP